MTKNLKAALNKGGKTPSTRVKAKKSLPKQKTERSVHISAPPPPVNVEAPNVNVEAPVVNNDIDVRELTAVMERSLGNIGAAIVAVAEQTATIQQLAQQLSQQNQDLLAHISNMPQSEPVEIKMPPRPAAYSVEVETKDGKKHKMSISPKKTH